VDLILPPSASGMPCDADIKRALRRQQHEAEVGLGRIVVS
jgi:hypothetical protein